MKYPSDLGGPVRAAEQSPARHRRSGETTQRPDRSRREDLEGVRAIAVLGVVIYHLKTSWLPGGFAGVDVFFAGAGSIAPRGGFLGDDLGECERVFCGAVRGQEQV